MKKLFFGVLAYFLGIHYSLAQEEDLISMFGDEDMVSLATGKQQPIAVAPAVTTVITSEDIKEIGATSLGEVLETVPGLHVGLNQFYNPIFTIRGIASQFNSQVLVLVNGISISNLYLGSRGLTWGGMPVEAISRIEVIRGPGSAVYGADAFAGTVNIITKSHADLKNTETGVQYGSFNSVGAWIMNGSEVSGFNVFFSLEYQSSDGHEEIIDSDLQTILDTFVDGTDVSLAPGPVNLSREALDARLDLSRGNWQLRAGMQERRNLGTGAGVAEVLDPEGRFAGSRRNLDLTYHNPDAFEDWDFSTQISYFYTTQEIEEQLILFPPGSKLGNGPAAPAFTGGVIGNPEVFEKHWRFNTSAFYEGFDRHTVRLGAGYQNADIYKVRESKNFGLDGDGNVIFPGSPVVSVDDTPAIFLPEGGRNNKYVFLQDVWKINGDWELTSGIRHDDYSDFGSTTNPRLALVWSTAHNLTTKFLFGKAFRAPAFVDTRNQNNPVALGNPDLKPEEIETFEVAFDYRPSNITRIGLNLFTYNWDNIIDLYPDPPPATTKTAQNLGEQEGDGIEFEIESELSPEFSVIGNLTYQDSINKNTDFTAADAPKRQLYVRGNWKFSKNWNGIVQINAVMDRAREMGDIRSGIDDYSLSNLSLGYTSDSHSWEVRFIARNIADEDAREASSSSFQNDFPLAGRNYIVELRYKFE
jgi:iron complex outermembrane receptor protein